MVGRNNRVIVDALELVAQELHGQQNQAIFRAQFLEKYFPKDVRKNKEIEFLELKKGSLMVAEYAAKFEELVKLCLHYNSVVVDVDDYVPRSNKLLVTIAESNLLTTRVLVRIKGKDSFEESRHRANECSSAEKECYKYGKIWHLIADCKGNVVTCYNCGEQGHKNTNYHKLRKLRIEESSLPCLGRRLPVLILDLNLSFMVGSMVIDTSANGSITTSLLEFNCVHINCFGKILMFLEIGGDGKLMFIFVKQVEEFLKEDS
ncbi:uncharacterized protein LOC127101732 [Lathyrus oleraceus]|uniref:uncharacterized protein LOC127101732 n=1 Tax=Pisum sativum TaxID=3888 RepID=UPI0021D12F09|nr:uncharacterized protein LOC127101732 [Pisum sativum]